MGVNNLFFSIADADKHKITLYKELATLKHFQWDIRESYSLPVGLRQFFIKQIIERLEAEKEAMEKARMKN